MQGAGAQPVGDRIDSSLHPRCHLRGTGGDLADRDRGARTHDGQQQEEGDEGGHRAVQWRVRAQPPEERLQEGGGQEDRNGEGATTIVTAWISWTTR